MSDVDAVVIGSGPNGLMAANLLAEVGWEVVVVEAQPTVGGAVRSDSSVSDGYVHDMFSSFSPLAAASPAIAPVPPPPGAIRTPGWHEVMLVHRS